MCLTGSNIFCLIVWLKPLLITKVYSAYFPYSEMDYYVFAAGHILQGSLTGPHPDNILTQEVLMVHKSFHSLYCVALFLYLCEDFTL